MTLAVISQGRPSPSTSRAAAEPRMKAAQPGQATACAQRLGGGGNVQRQLGDAVERHEDEGHFQRVGAGFLAEGECGRRQAEDEGADDAGGAAGDAVGDEEDQHDRERAEHGRGQAQPELRIPQGDQRREHQEEARHVMVQEGIMHQGGRGERGALQGEDLVEPEWPGTKADEARQEGDDEDQQRPANFAKPAHATCSGP